MKCISGLYAITPAQTNIETLCHQVQQALAGGARSIQYRDKHGSANMRRARLERLLSLTRAHGALLIVNDDIELAVEAGADGVHIGATDASPSEARARLGAYRVLGVSCYNRIELAAEALDCGADYVAFGSVFPSQTKPEAVHAPLELIASARAQFAQACIVAIGGVTRSNAAAVFRAGGDAVAVISDLFEAEDVCAAARQFSALFHAGVGPAVGASDP